MFPPVPQSMVDEGYQDFADRWNPVLDVFDEMGVRFAHEVHPSEIAYDHWTMVAALEAVGHREAFGLNWDPSHFVWQDLDPVAFLWDFSDRIYHVDPVGLLRCHAARVKSRRCRWVVRVRSRGRPLHQASRRTRLTAVAAMACSRPTLGRPV